MAGVMRRSRILHTVLVAALTLMFLPGCVLYRLARPDDDARPEPSDIPRGTQGAVGPTGVGWKVVSGKREPIFLLARDGTECMVSKARWEKARLGSQHLCLWTEPTG